MVKLPHMRSGRLAILCIGLGALVGLTPACASLEFKSAEEGGGTFTSTAWAFTFLSLDYPGPALSIARGNAADSGQSELVIRKERVLPHFGPLDWILDIISIRYARVQGTFGRPTGR